MFRMFITTSKLPTNWLKRLIKMMKKSAFILLVVLTFLSCRKDDPDFLWEKTFGKGIAYQVIPTADSGLVVCGVENDKPFVAGFSVQREVRMTYAYESNGLFSSVWYDTTGYIAAGCSAGKLLIAAISTSGILKWDTLITSPFGIGRAYINYSGYGEMLVTGTPDPDTTLAGASGLLFVRIDTTGDILEFKQIDEEKYVAAGGAFESAGGFIYLPLTRKPEFTQTKASVACFNSSFQKIWETELYNNPDFGASALAITADESSGNIYSSGMTRVTRSEGTVDNSFISCLSSTGSVRWKKYTEIGNSSTDIIIGDETIYALNRKCLSVNKVAMADGEDEGIIRLIDACESSTTTLFGNSISFNYDGNLIVAGARNGNFYIALEQLVQ